MMIKNPKHIKQIQDFTGIERTRSIRPTDIDGLIDYAGHSFIYMEGKYNNKELPKGQKIALQNVVNSHNMAGHTAAAIIYNHNEKAPQPVIVAQCLVTKIYYKGKWTEAENITVLQFIEKWESRILCKRENR